MLLCHPFTVASNGRADYENWSSSSLVFLSLLLVLLWSDETGTYMPLFNWPPRSVDTATKSRSHVRPSSPGGNLTPGYYSSPLHRSLSPGFPSVRLMWLQGKCESLQPRSTTNCSCTVLNLVRTSTVTGWGAPLRHKHWTTQSFYNSSY